MAELPTEMIIKILSKLPVKSLLRFQCVCKSWQSIIRSPNFIKTHLNQTLTSHSNHLLLVSVEHSSLLSSELDHHSLSFSELHHPLKHRNGLQLLGSCNGVVCISNISKTDVVLFNPLTNSHRKLPSTNFPIPNIAMIVFGFGYDRKNDDYKVLRIVQGLGDIEDSKNKVELYSLNNNSWKCIQGIPYYLYSNYPRGVLVNEGLHYVVTQESFTESLFIAKFDLLTETYSLMNCPNYDDKSTTNSLNSTLTLEELGGRLCLLITCYYTSDRLESFHEMQPPDDFDLDDELDARVLEHVDLWVMKEYGNELSWVRLFSIQQPGDIGSYKSIGTIVYSKDGRRILLEIDSSGYCWYDLESKNVERVTAHGLPNGVFKMGAITGSLVSLEDQLLSRRESLPKKNKKKHVADNFLSTGFNLRL